MPDNNKITDVKDLKAGTECWAWQYDWPAGLSLPLASQKPVRGILAELPNRIGDTSRSPGWFVPYSGRSKKPAFTKAVRVESVNLHSEKSEAQEAYNAKVRKIAARFLDLADMCQQDLVKLEKDGFVRGWLEDYPIMRVDLSKDYPRMFVASEANLEPNPDFHEGEIMTWAEFDRRVEKRIITHYDGCANLQLDGKGCDNALLDIYRGLVYIPDRYAIPFRHVPEAFQGHEITVLWTPK